jgi:hypothetical protein
MAQRKPPALGWFFCLLVVALPLVTEGQTLIPALSTWRYWKGTNEASSPASAWRNPAYSDAHWAVGAAPFHYGEGLSGGTTLADMRNRYTSVFLRREFQVAAPGEVQELRLIATCDDGFVAWINGREVARYNLPAGEVAYNGLASQAVPEPVESAVYLLPSPDYLMAGRNVIAVQVFNTSLTSSDLRWDGELFAAVPDREAPRVQSVDPPGGVVEDLTQVTVMFSEPVMGVRASDLLLGAQPAQTVSGSAERYVFRFGAPVLGAVELRWEADAVITDMASPPNRFDPAQASIFQYQVVDRRAPVLAEVLPRSGATVRSLAQVEVLFSEPVLGVDPSDLLVNGQPAVGVTGDAAGPYRFQLDPPPPGRLLFSWAVDHGIRDRAEPGNSFVAQGWEAQLDPNYAPPLLRINEFLAANLSSAGLKDEEGQLQDWIEIYNQHTAAVSLEGWALTDDAGDPGRWVFPAVTLQPGQFLVVFASGKNRVSAAPGAKLHTNFKLNPAGEYLGLWNAESPRVAMSEFGPAYPEQRNDYSYGIDDQGQGRYFSRPTPGAANGSSQIEGVVPPPQFDVERGWFDAPFDLTISSSMSGVIHRYTINGSQPTETQGQVYSGPLRIATSTVLRVVSYKPGLLPSTAVTHTYLFVEDVLKQSNTPAGFPVGPNVMGGFPSDYEMDPEITTHPLYQDRLRPALRALPVISVVCDGDDLFSAADGIYTHPLNRGPEWERPCSVEWIAPDGGRGLQVNAGIQIQGNAAREPRKQPKHPLRLVFKGDYGPTALDFRMFPDSPISRFDTLILRADFNYSWLHWNPNQRIRAQRTRDAWMKDTMRAMGALASHNRYVHLFINGLYWGVYDPSERPDGAFAASYLGGEKEDYDVMNEGEVVDGASRAYQEMLNLSNLADPAIYANMRQYLDVTQFIDYMLLHFYVGHTDWGQNKNWYAVRPKDGRQGFYYVPWDGEMILDDPNYNRVSSTDTPSGLHTKLVANPEYRLAFADQAQKHLFSGGALTPAVVEARWMERAGQIDLAIVAESARWGDYRRDVHQYQNGPYELYTRDQQWIAEQQRLRTEYFPRRTATLLSQLRAAGLFPEVDAPQLGRLGGLVEAGSQLTLTARQGLVYFTTDGTDPRVAGTGAVSPRAVRYDAPMTLENTVRIRARAVNQGQWSALIEADFRVDEPEYPIRITEVMYHPAGGDAFEFVELQNVGRRSLDLTGFSLNGIDYVFPFRTVLGSGQILVLASSLNPAAFAARYPGVAVAGHFRGTLSNGGERLELRDRSGQWVTMVDYSDGGAWPHAADGQGASLEILDPAGDPCDPANWIALESTHGSPGRPTTVTSPETAPVRLNEILAQGYPPDDTEGVDWIELANPGPAPVGLDGWRLTDHDGEAFVFPAGTLIPAQDYLVIWCDGETNAASGLHTSFRLAREGERIGLYDASGNRIDAVTYGSQVGGYSVGWVGALARWTLNHPTPGAVNSAAEVAQPLGLKINEWYANPPAGEPDWVELYHPDTSRPVALGGLLIAAEDDAFLLAPLSYIAPRGFVRLVLDNRIGPGHVAFKLPAEGGVIRLLDSREAELDHILYGPQTEGISEGRLADGGPDIGPLTHGPTPGRSNQDPLPDTDSDQDGLPDVWEIAHGTHPYEPDAQADTDDDGLSNREEFLAGTHPKDPASALRLQAVRVTSQAVSMQFLAVSNRTYSVLYQDRVGTPAWSKLADVPALPASRLETVVDSQPSATERFYCVVTPGTP